MRSSQGQACKRKDEEEDEADQDGVKTKITDTCWNQQMSANKTAEILAIRRLAVKTNELQGFLSSSINTANCKLQDRNRKFAYITLALLVVLLSDLAKLVIETIRDDQMILSSFEDMSLEDEASPRGSLSLSGSRKPRYSLAWASWIGEIPTAAELYAGDGGDGEGASESSPSSAALEDDDDDDDEELDSAASNEYPDNDSDNDNDEAYEDNEDNPESQEESRPEASWLKTVSDTVSVVTPKPDIIRQRASGHKITKRSSYYSEKIGNSRKLGGQSIWNDLEGWRRNKRDIEDRIILASRQAAARVRQNQRERGSDGLSGDKSDDFTIDDGDEDAWVHDGVDDIHIDPETKRAASELSQDEKSVDSEYDQPQPVVNRTRVTTISEVIPMQAPAEADGNGGAYGEQQGAGPSGGQSSTRRDSRFALPPGGPKNGDDNDNDDNEAEGDSTGATNYLPAALLSMDQVQQLVQQQQQKHNPYAQDNYGDIYRR